jgi:hypothetical protein
MCRKRSAETLDKHGRRHTHNAAALTGIHIAFYIGDIEALDARQRAQQISEQRRLCPIVCASDIIKVRKALATTWASTELNTAHLEFLQLRPELLQTCNKGWMLSSCAVRGRADCVHLGEWALRQACQVRASLSERSLVKRVVTLTPCLRVQCRGSLSRPVDRHMTSTHHAAV